MVVSAIILDINSTLPRKFCFIGYCCEIRPTGSEIFPIWLSTHSSSTFSWLRSTLLAWIDGLIQIFGLHCSLYRRRGPLTWNSLRISSLCMSRPSLDVIGVLHLSSPFFTSQNCILVQLCISYFFCYQCHQLFILLEIDRTLIFKFRLTGYCRYRTRWIRNPPNFVTHTFPLNFQLTQVTLPWLAWNDGLIQVVVGKDERDWNHSVWSHP